jgi:hypothetical protein
VPDELASRVAEVTEGQSMNPIAILETQRTVVTLRGRDGQTVAEVADDVVTARRLPERGEPLRWREIEVEVPSADSPLQRAAADTLLAAGAWPAGHASKLARVLNG